MATDREKRPLGVACLIVFLLVAAGISGAAALSLRWPGGPLDVMWGLKPAAREEFASLGFWAPVLLGLLCPVCAASAVGLWRRSRLGYRVVFVGLALNMAGDLFNLAVRHQLGAMLGIPIVAAILFYLTRDRIRSYFGLRPTAGR